MIEAGAQARGMFLKILKIPLGAGRVQPAVDRGASAAGGGLPSLLLLLYYPRA